MTPSIRRVLSAVLGAALAAGCAEPEQVADLPELRDLPRAPAAIRRAADGVVRIELPDGSAGTGSFISDRGLLMTNNHVLGAEACPIEGCWVALSFLHQRGEATSDPRDLFAVPVHIDVGLDLAILQVYESGSESAPLDTPYFLSFAERASAAALVGRHIYIVGHPRGRLKKWSSGVVVDAGGAWFQTTAFILPGDSGSPVLDDAGEIVGLIHRSRGGESLFSELGSNFSSLGTAVGPLLEAMQAPLPPIVLSTQADASAAQVVARSALYLCARTPEASVAGQPTSVLTLLGEACDAGLARDDYRSPDEQEDALKPCWDALDWIECRTDAAGFEHAVCPEDDAQSAWLERFQAVYERQRALNGELELTPISFGVASLSPSLDEGRTQARERLEAALAEAQPIFDFPLALYLAAFELESYAGKRTVDMVSDYRRVPHYELYAMEIASAALWLGTHELLSGSRTLAILRELWRNPRVDIGAKLYLEEVLYNSGAL